MAVAIYSVVSRYAGGGVLANPGLRQEEKKIVAQPGVVTPTPTSQTASYNPPQEIKYNSSTDLQKELESVSPQVLDSDFE